MSACSPSAPDSIEASTQCSPRRSSVQYSRIRTDSVNWPSRLMWRPLRVDHVVPQLRLDPDDDPIEVVGAALAAQQADVLDLRRADRLDDVAPALALEVVEPSLPLDQQLRRDQPAQRDPVVGRPGELDVREQLCGRLAHRGGPEDRILVLGLGGGQLDAALALAALAAVRAALPVVCSPVHQEASGRRGSRSTRRRTTPISTSRKRPVAVAIVEDR